MSEPNEMRDKRREEKALTVRSVKHHAAAIDGLFAAAEKYLLSCGFSVVVIGGTIIQSSAELGGKYRNELVIKFVGGKTRAKSETPKSVP